MKKLLALILLCSPAFPANWFATSSSVNINAASLWVPTSTGSCTGSGTALSFGSQATGDVFNANGCTAIAINVDPGGSSVQVTLTNDATNGGGFTYATATNITIHAHVTTNKANCLAVSGSTGGGTLSGNVTGGPSTNSSAVSDTHTLVTVNVTGNLLGGTNTNARGYAYGAGTGTVSVTGNATGGTGNASAGLYLSNGTATITGNCIGGAALENPGCDANSSGPIVVVGSLIYSSLSSPAAGRILFTPVATNYILAPKDASYTTGTIDTHAVEMPTNPGVGNVLSPTAYGSFTGTLSAGSATVGYPHVQ